MRKRWMMIAATALVAIAAVVARPAFTQITTPAVAFAAHAQPAVLPFDFYRDSRIVVRGTINGHATDMILDTGAGLTTLDRQFARSIGLTEGRPIEARGVGGAVEAELFQDVTLTVGPMTLTNLTVLALDFQPVARALGRPMPVVLGREFFMNGIVGIDFEARTLTVADPARFVPPPGATAIPLGRDGRLHTMQVAVAGLPPTTAHVDLGNGGTLLVAHAYWRKQPTLSALRHAGGEAGGVGGFRPTRRVTMPSVAFGGHRFDAVPAELNVDPAALPDEGLNIGIGMFRPFDVTLDLRRDRLFLQRNGWSGPWPRDRTGMRIELADRALTVAHVSPDSPADRAGLKTGDSIIAIDARPVTPTYFQAGDHRWTRGAPGTRVTLTRRDGSTATLTLADYF